jgi:hypothetical protein
MKETAEPFECTGLSDTRIRALYLGEVSVRIIIRRMACSLYLIKLD